MPREFVELPAGLELQVRARVAKECHFDEARSAGWELRAAKLSFYRNAWLAYLHQPSNGLSQRQYFVIDFGVRGRKPKHVIPVANVAGAVDRVNRELKLEVKNKASFLDYLNFYYAFTPKVVPAQRGRHSSAQFAVPLETADLVIEGEHAAIREPLEDGCAERCLVLGAAWQFLDLETRRRFAPLKFKKRMAPYFSVAARLPVQLEDALFAADVKLKERTGRPVLSHVELLYQGGLRPPPTLPSSGLALPAWISRKEFWRRIWNRVTELSRGVAVRAGTALSWAVTLVFVYLWGLSALFPVLEMLKLALLRRHMEWLSGTLGLAAWPTTLIQLTAIALAAFLLQVYYLTSIDKIFNWLFWLCPRRWERRLETFLNPRLEKHDRDLIVQDTFRKRALLALRLLLIWSSYAILAFSTLQIAVNIAAGSQTATAGEIVGALIKQAAINVPLIAYFMLRLPELFGRLDPVGQNVLSAWILICFQVVMAMVILKGIYRIWVFTKEASPNVFYRKLVFPRGARHA